MIASYPKEYLVRAILVGLATANFWYWIVLPMPPQEDPGLSYDYLVPWLGCSVILAFLAGLAEARSVIGAVLVALGPAIALVPYTLFGFADRQYGPPHLEWKYLVHIMTLVGELAYFGVGFVLAIAPAYLGARISRYLRR